MKKHILIALIALLALASFMGCKEYTVEYKDPFAGKMFFDGYDTTSEKQIIFQNGEAVIYYYDEFFAQSGNSGSCSVSELTTMKKIKLGTFTYTFDGANKKLSLTPKEIYSPSLVILQCWLTEAPDETTEDTISWVRLGAIPYDYGTTTTNNYEIIYNPKGGEHLDHDGYAAVLAEDLTMEKTDSFPGSMDLFQTVTVAQELADVMFKTVVYDYDFAANYVSDSPYTLTLTTDDPQAYFSTFKLTKVASIN